MPTPESDDTPSPAPTHVGGAIFHGADLRGADLSGVVGLTPEQLATAILDETTILPEGIQVESA